MTPVKTHEFMIERLEKGQKREGLCRFLRVHHQWTADEYLLLKSRRDSSFFGHQTSHPGGAGMLSVFIELVPPWSPHR